MRAFHLFSFYNIMWSPCMLNHTHTSELLPALPAPTPTSVAVYDIL